jgi:hypothetical protein
VDGVQVGEEAEMEGDLNGDGDLPAAAAAMEVAGAEIARAPRGRRERWCRLPVRRGVPVSKGKERCGGSAGEAGRGAGAAVVAARNRTRRRRGAPTSKPCTVARCGGRNSISARVGTNFG